MVNPRVEAWEEKLNKILRQTDRELEKNFGSRYPIHPARPANGTTSNPQQDGLFRIYASFTPGFGSDLGKGYALDIDIPSLEKIDPEFRQEVETFAVERIRQELEKVFPGRGMELNKDGNVWKITGDLSL